MRHDRRGPKKHRSGLLPFLILAAAFVGVAFLVASPSTSHPGVQPSPIEDAFYGSIVNVEFRSETTGVVKADTNCKPVENGLTNCIGIITAADGTELRFNYSHDMSKQPCLAPGDRVTIMTLDDGTVKVVRG